MRKKKKAQESKITALRNWLREVVFGIATPIAKGFDILLIVLIVFSIILVMLESVKAVDYQYNSIFYIFEWVITGLFTLEYLIRVWISPRRWNYIFSFFGIIDLLSILPSFISLFLITTKAFVVIRSMRLIRIFRILKLTRYTQASQILLSSLKASRAKIAVFLSAVLILVIIVGTFMYIIEGPEHGFTSIPKSIYWTIVTLTTVGYGDISPMTPLGQFVASFVMVLGFGVIAVPTGIVSADIAYQNSKRKQDLEDHPKTEEDTAEIDHFDKKRCSHCHTGNQPKGAIYCYHCGKLL
ncbi:MAG: ion transporter [Bacteroidaceae bacterium]